eukprot:TRINITY_DN4420_c0_g1_i1.p1 TRINITY_DN4420_c0_g1~~TRINITY_DN4420_c0_g1_i1.p1  ORF type:complete len:620 (-),score=144.50 TRINITY_DN4420_c0_g1_i1:23-1882(-)
MSVLWVHQDDEKHETVMRQLEKEEAETDFKFSLLLEGPQSNWLVGFRTVGDRLNWKESLTKAMRAAGKCKDPVKGTRTGRYDFSVKGRYEGRWKDGWMHKDGTLVTPNGTKFVGRWHCKHRCGFGTVETPTSSARQTAWQEGSDGQIVLYEKFKFWENTELRELDWQMILTGATVETKEKDVEIITQGKANTHLYKLLEGTLRIEKGLTPTSPKVVLTTLNPPVILGDTSVIASINQATASVIAHTSLVKLQVISISILNTLLRSDPGLSMRFFRAMALKLRAQLLRLHGPTKEELKEDDDDSSITDTSEEGGNSKRTKAPAKALSETQAQSSPPIQQKSQHESPAQKFHLPESEVMLKLVECTMKGVMKKLGRLYIFSNNVCFDSHVFGSSTKIVIEIFKITDIQQKKDILEIKTNKQKYLFSQVQEPETVFKLLNSLWTETRTRIQKGDKVNSQKLDKKSMASQTSLSTDSKPIEMEAEDWGMVLKDAKYKEYQNNEVVLKEGASSTSIFQIVSGRVCIQKQTADGIKKLGTMESEALFGEMSFLASGCATASIIAEGRVKIAVLEQTALYMLFVKNPHLAGRFYSYLANILALRLSERELQIQKYEIRKEKRKQRT